MVECDSCTQFMHIHMPFNVTQAHIRYECRQKEGQQILKRKHHEVGEHEKHDTNTQGNPWLAIQITNENI